MRESAKSAVELAMAFGKLFAELSSAGAVS